VRDQRGTLLLPIDASAMLIHDDTPFCARLYKADLLWSELKRQDLSEFKESSHVAVREATSGNASVECANNQRQ
jgi:hypothetical protein